MTQPIPPALRRSRADYRRWTKEQKRQIVEETFAPGTSVSIVARRHDVNSNQVFEWRKLYRRGEYGNQLKTPAEFIPIGVIGQDGRLVASRRKPMPDQGAPSTPAAPLPATSPQQEGIIEIVLRQGIRVRLKGNVDLALLRYVITTAASLP